MFDLTLDPLSRVREAYPREVFRKLGLPEYVVPKMHEGLPQGTHFKDDNAIAKCWMGNALLFRYQDLPLPPSASLILFTWVMSDGLGDWAAQHTAFTVLKKALPNLHIELVTLVEENEKRVLFHQDAPSHVFSYKDKDPAYIPQTVLQKLSHASLILQLPTFYPHPMPPSTSIGEYGFINSEWFHPESGNLCMGLHPLEKGLLLHSDLISTDIFKGSPFYFAYLVTKRGYAIYLHALLKGTKTDLKLITCNFLPLLEALKEEDWSGYELKEIILRDTTNETIISLNETGRRLTIECRQNLSSHDVQKLILSSENFVGCRGDRSFSEVISLERLFFYDLPVHSRPFLQDLCEVVKFYCPAYPSLLAYLQCLLDQKTEAKILGSTIGELLYDPSLPYGMQKLITLLKSDFFFNPSLVNFVKANILHHFTPGLKEREETHFKEFLEGAHSLESMIYGRRT